MEKLDGLFLHLSCKYHHTRIISVSLAEDAPRRFLCAVCLEELPKKGYNIVPFLGIKDCISSKAISKWCSDLSERFSPSKLTSNNQKAKLMDDMDRRLDEINGYLVKIREELTRRFNYLGYSNASAPSQLKANRERLYQLLRSIYLTAPEENPDLEEYCQIFRSLVAQTEESTRKGVNLSYEESYEKHFNTISDHIRSLRDKVYEVYKASFENRAPGVYSLPLSSTKKISHFRSVSTDRVSSRGRIAVV